MFSSFKKLFRKDTGDDLATSIPEVQAPASASHSSGMSSQPVTLSFPPQSMSQAPAAAALAASGDTVLLSVHSVLARLPNSLAGVVQSQGNGFFSLPALWVAQELPKGAVKLSFGELRQMAPPGTFFDNPRHDQVLIELPLNEILTRLHPSHLARRNNQKQFFVPPDISDVFGPRGEGISLSAPPPPKTTKLDPVTAPSLKPIQLEPVVMAKVDKPLAAPAAPPSLRVVPSESPTVASGSLQVPLAALSASWPEMIQQELAAITGAVVFPMNQLELGLKSGKIVFTWKQICEWIRPPVSNSGIAEETTIELPLQILAPLFLAQRQPRVQKKVFISDMPDLFAGKTAVVSEPPPMVMAAPVPVAPAPIKMLEPVPAAAIKMAATVTPTIPIAPIAPPPPAAPIAMAPPTIAPVTKPNPIGELFGQPAKFEWTPNEIVKNLATLPNVAGAFVAMTDGLLVAAELPPQLKAETVAAFLPQIFGRMNQYAKELQLGGLSSLSFVAENVSWQIIKTKTVYLVAIGKPGESLPGSTLNTVAAELGQQIQ